MRPSVLSLNLQTAHSPSFGFLSPPIDTGDASSDDGDHDTLQTPLTGHDIHQHHYHLYQQHQQDFVQDIFHSYDPKTQVDPLASDTKTHLQPTNLSLSPLAPLVAPSAVSDPFSSLPKDDFFHSFSAPSNALDLANASLDIGHFGYNHALDAGASPFTPTKHGFDSVSAVAILCSDPSGSSYTALPDIIPSLSVEDLGDISALAAPSLPVNEPQSPTIPPLDDNIAIHGRSYSPRFSSDHKLNPYFVRSYILGDELGAGGYGFVMTARRRDQSREVAVKFIIKDKVPDHAWWQDEFLGRIPTEVMLLSLVEHENVVKCLDLYEDDVYFYLVQELHGIPWVSRKKRQTKQTSAPGNLIVPTPSSTPSLTPSPSFESAADSVLHTPPQPLVEHHEFVCVDSQGQPVPTEDNSLFITFDKPLSQTFLQPPVVPPIRPNFSRRPSHDLFECIEQSKHKRLSENQARYIFAQVVEAVHYLDSQGITHCDIKDENLVVDNDLQVKLIDFGSAVVADPSAPRPYHTLFFGTTAYASSEILQKRPYRAPPAEIWTLGVLLSYLLTGHSPFPTEQDAIEGRIILREPGKGAGRLSRAALSLMGRCLEKDPERRADITEVRGHRWLQGALERGASE